MGLKKLFLYLFICNIIILSFVVLIINNYTEAIKNLENAYNMQHTSVLLTEELRQSSDDLTRVARTYVSTGNTMYKKQFFTILDIRNGIKNRPEHYNRIYWDFLSLNNSIPILKGEKKALRIIMKEAGFKENELALLFKSQKESDKLTYLENKAFNAIEGKFLDKNGEYTIEKQSDSILANQIMYSEQYHKAKISIMQPLNEFYKLFEKRTTKKVALAHEKVKELEFYVSIAILVLITLLLVSFFIVTTRIIYPLEILKNCMLLLSNNDMRVQIPKNVYNDEVGEMLSSIKVFKNNALKLIQSEQKNKLLLDLAGEGIFGLDKQGRFTFLNPKACKLLGYKNDLSLIGKYIFDTVLVHEDDHSHAYNRLMLQLEKKLKFKKKDNLSFPIDYVSTPIRDKDNFIIGSVVVFNDSSKRKSDEDKLKKAINDSIFANQSKSIFLTNMSHELRTPLNTILGFASIIRKSPNLNNKEQENLSIIHKSGEHLLDIINEILDLSKIEAGKIDINPSDFNFKNFINEIEQMFRSKYEKKKLDFFLHVDPKIPKHLKCDKKRLKQILINLLTNALKFTQEGQVTLKVSIKKEQLCFEIIDSGIGIKEDDFELIFKPFGQSNININSKNSTGLGLGISKKLINKMGGDIWVKSTFKKGSVFYFTIFIEVSNKEKIIYKDKHRLALGLKNKDNTKKILIVDDILENRLFLKQLLAIYGLKTFEAKNSKEALLLYKKENIDLIFMDISMPEVDGFETTKLIREKTSNKDLIIVMVSAHAFKEHEQKSLEVGANTFLTKPLKEEHLIEVLQNYLNLEFIYKEEQVSYKQTQPIKKETLFHIQKASTSLNKRKIEDLLLTCSRDSIFVKEINEALKDYDFFLIEKKCEELLKKV